MSKRQPQNQNLRPPRMEHIRNIKPEFFKHEGVNELSLGAVIAWIGLWTVSDRNGVFIWKPKALKLSIFPYRDIDIEPLLLELIQAEFVKKFSADGQDYGFSPKWKLHQHIGTHEAAVKNLPYPPPPIEPAQSTNEAGTVPAQFQHSATTQGVGVGEGVDVGNGMGDGFGVGSTTTPPTKPFKRSRKTKVNPEPRADNETKSESYSNEEYTKFFTSPSSASMFVDQLRPFAKDLIPLAAKMFTADDRLRKYVPNDFRELAKLLHAAEIPELKSVIKSAEDRIKLPHR